MKALIIEDEKAAARNLRAVLEEIPEHPEVVGETDSIVDTISWFHKNPMPDLVFMDIHLADGSAFEIFEHINITCPIIFTTAYDEYALRAFRVNSIAYLLKPISKKNLEDALAKLDNLCRRPSGENAYQLDLAHIMKELKKEESYKTHFLIPAKGDKLVPISVHSILYFYISDGVVKAVDTNRCKYTFPQSLDELADQLDPRRFFRVNRQFIISKEAIEDVHLWFNGRLTVNLKVPVPEKIIVSKAKAREFKEWF